MIYRMPWPTQNHNSSAYAYSQKRNNSYIISNANMKCGKKLMDAVFEDAIAPLIQLRGIEFTTIPKDGDFQNVDMDNILVSGIGAKKGLDAESAKRGELLRVEYDPDDNVFSYIYVKNGVTEELRYRNFNALRNKLASSPAHHGLKNKKYLLTPAEYRVFFDDFASGKLGHDGSKIDICSYKNEQIL